MPVAGVIPGLPDLDAQERRDGRPAGTYQGLVDRGLVTPDEGRRVVRVETLVASVMHFQPEVIVCDRFRADRVRDAVAGRCPVVVRQTRWSESTEDIMATRRLALDGDLAVVPEVRPLYRFTLAQCMVEEDDDNNVHLRPKGGGAQNTRRDDLAAAFVLAAGALSRAPGLESGSRLIRA